MEEGTLCSFQRGAHTSGDDDVLSSWMCLLPVFFFGNMNFPEPRMADYCTFSRLLLYLLHAPSLPSFSVCAANIQYQHRREKKSREEGLGC